MTQYALYLESGPKRRTTMVHVLELLGCVHHARTTDDALAGTPDAIRAFLRFLSEHGDEVDPESGFTTVVAAHVMEGPWIGYGDPAPGFGPDFRELAAEEAGILLRRLRWMQEEYLARIRPLPPERLLAEPPAGGRSLYRITEHVSGAHVAYLRQIVAKVERLPEAQRAVSEVPDDLALALAEVFRITNARLEALTEEERRREVPHGQTTWTARRTFRRMLEHLWEHLNEVRERLAVP